MGLLRVLRERGPPAPTPQSPQVQDKREFFLDILDLIVVQMGVSALTPLTKDLCIYTGSFLHIFRAVTIPVCDCVKDVKREKRPSEAILCCNPKKALKFKTKESFFEI